MLGMEETENECLSQYKNSSLLGFFCTAAWDSFLCWPPTPSGEVISRPCPQLNSHGAVIGRSPNPDMFALRICDETGRWLDNKTNFTRCVANISDLYPDPWAPTVIALIVFVCSMLSLISLLISLFIFCYFNCLKCSRLKVHRNLSLALLMNLILLIVSSSPVLLDVSYKRYEWVCKSVLSLQMYSAMASINWMFVEGLLLHSRVTVHIFKQDAPFPLYYCIGWGFPAVFIGCWCLAMYNYRNTHCWEGYGDLPFIWLITGPMMVALLINSIFLVDIIRVLVSKRHANMSVDAAQVRCALYDGAVQPKLCPWQQLQPRQSNCSRRKAIKATALLFPLLGIPHLLFCINPKDNGTLEDVYMIVNAFVKSSQGLFVSVLYCFMNNDVQTALRKAYMRAAARRNPNSRYTNRGKGTSQTSGTYMSSHSDGGPLSDAAHRVKGRSSRTVFQLHENPRSMGKKKPGSRAVIL